MANPVVGLGFKSYWQFGREAVYGTPVAATHKLDLLESDVKLVQNVIRDESLWGKISRQTMYQGGSHYAGKIKVRCQYEGLAMLLDWYFGTATYGSAGGTTTGPVNAIYNHTFIEREYLNSYTVEIVEGDIAAGKCFKLTSATCIGMTITGGVGGAGEILTVELDIVAQDKTSGATPTAALKTPEISLTAYTPVLYYQMLTPTGSLGDGTSETGTSGAVRITAFTLSLTNSAAIRGYLGSQKIDQPVRNGWVEAKWKLTQEFRSPTLFDAARAFTTSFGSVGMAYNDVLSPGVRSLAMSSNVAKLIDYSAPINKYGIIESTADWEGLYDTASTSCAAVVLGNTKATVSTAYA